MDDKLTIRVNILDRSYPLKIERKDEEKIRKAAKKINDTVSQYQKLYGDKDGQDFLAMASLQFVIKNIESEENQEVHPLIEEIIKAEQKLEKILQEE